MNHEVQINIIESVMDSCDSYAEFMEVIAEVFSLKADHLESNWQDYRSAEIANRFAAAVLNVPILVERSFHEEK